MFACYTFQGNTVQVLCSGELGGNLNTAADESFAEDMVQNGLKFGIKLKVVEHGKSVLWANEGNANCGQKFKLGHFSLPFPT